MNDQVRGYGPSFFGHHRVSTLAELKKAKEAMATGARPAAIDPESPTWRAVVRLIEERSSGTYIPMLRNKQCDFNDVSYARGAMDLIDAILTLADGMENFG